MEFITNLISKLVGFDATQVILALVVCNALIFTVQTFLDGVKNVLVEYQDKTKTDLDNKAVLIVSKASGGLAKVLGIMSKILDVLGANKKH